MVYLLFDCDGTLMDSMDMWENLARRVMKKYGVDLPLEDDRATASMSHTTACFWFADKYFDGKNADKLLADFNAVLDEQYAHHLPLKEHVRPVLDRLYEADVPMAIASSTDERLLRLAFDRLGITDYFSFIQSVDNAGHSKDSAEYYELAAERFGTSLDKMLFFDDALYAIKRAEATGLRTVAVYDPTTEDQRDDIIAAASAYIQDFSEFPWEEVLPS